MSTVIVRYQTKPDRADENQKLIETVFTALAEAAPAGLRYGSFRLADGVSFVHIAAIETGDASNPLTELAEFAAFQAEISDRCVEGPTALEATLVGSYRFPTD